MRSPRTNTPAAAPSIAAATTVSPRPSSSATIARSPSERSKPPFASSAGRPTTTVWPSTTASMPSPARLVKLSTGASGPTSPRAKPAIARAIGCSLASSAEPASRRSRARSPPGSATALGTRSFPSVTVPVLSSRIVVIRRVCSSTSGPLIRIPSWAPRPLPTMSAVGVASPRAHGQAMISTATAAVNAADASPVSASQPTSVASEIAITIGTKTAEIRSTSRWIGALPAWASATRRAICGERGVGADLRRLDDEATGDVLIVAPATEAPSPTSTGTGSPVSIDWSTAETPATTTPSVAIFSPGRTTKRSPTTSSSTGTSTSVPPRRTCASLAPSSSSARIASPERRRARASR